MIKIPVRAVFGEAFCHESEDLEKVRKAFFLFFPKKSVKEQKADAGIGATVTILRAKLERKQAKQAAEKILGSLSLLEKNRLLSELNIRLSEEGSFCIMFDKQIAYSTEKIELTDSEDSVKLNFFLEAFPANPSKLRESAVLMLKH